VVSRILDAVARNGKIQRLTVLPLNHNIVLPLRDCLVALRDKLVFLCISTGMEEEGFRVQDIGTVEDAQVVGAAVRAVSTLAKLELYKMDQSYFVALVGQLVLGEGIPNLHHLTINSADSWNNNPTGTGRAIQNMINATANLTDFKFAFNWMFGDSAFALTEMVLGAVHNHPSIRKFDCNYIHFMEVEDHGPTHFPVLLRNNNVLQVLSVDGYCNMSDLLELLGLLETNTILKRLEFCVEHSFDRAFMLEHRHIGRLVSRLQGLQVLKLFDNNAGNYIPAEQIPVEFAQGFANNTSLTEIDFKWIPDTTELGKALQFYAARNEYKPMLVDQIACSKRTMVATFEDLHQTKPETCALSVIFEVLRARDDWRGHAGPVPPVPTVVQSAHCSSCTRSDVTDAVCYGVEKRPSETQDQGVVSKRAREQEKESDDVNSVVSEAARDD